MVAVMVGEKIIYISAYRLSLYCCMYAITESGKLYSWGRNGNGQLGLGNTTQQTTPQEITAVSGSSIRKQKSCSCYFLHQDGDDVTKVGILTDEGKVYFAIKENHMVFTVSK